MTLYMAVTNDKYELPLVVSESSKAVDKYCSNFKTNIKLSKNNLVQFQKKPYKIVQVIV